MTQPRVLVAALLTLFLSTLPASAQSRAAQRRDRARTFLVLRITDALKLSDADALKVSKLLREADDHRQDLLKQRQVLEDKLRTALDKQPVDTATLGKLITDGNALDEQLALVPEHTFRSLQKLLTVEQQAKLMLFRRELQKEIQRALTRRAGALWGGRGRRGQGGGGSAVGALGAPAAGE